MPNAAFLASALAISAGLLSGCGAAEPPPAASPAPATPAPPPAPPPAQPAAAAPEKPAEAAHKLAILAVSCWFGGLWADAIGEIDQARIAGIEGRCHELERRVWGDADKTHYEQVRAFEQNAVADVIARVDLLTKEDAVDGPRRDALVRLVEATAAATHETMLARRAADRVKRDLDREPDKLNADEVAAVGPLRAHAKLEALLRLDAGNLTKEAHALALLLVLDRVDVARGLPKHLKLYAVADAFQILFGVTPPDVPSDGSQKLTPGTWLKFLSEVAKAAGHPVPAKAKTAREQDALAWAGMQQGMSDKLSADNDGVGPATDLAKVVTTVIHRLNADLEAQQAALDTLKNKPAPKPPVKK